MLAPTSLAAIGNTPLVAFDNLRPSGGARIFAKWEGANPTGSMKDRMALAMIQGALREGLLVPGQRVVEYTGGSTGSSLAFVCAALGHPLSIVTADCFSLEKIRTMMFLGADVEVLKTPNGRTYPGLGKRIYDRAQQIQAETGAYWTNQIENPHQVEGYVPMGHEILADCPGITDFVMGVGGGGCSMGNARAFREAGVEVHVTLIEPAEAPYISTDTMHGEHDVEGIAVFPRSRLQLLDDTLFDEMRQVPEEQGFAMARRIGRETGMLIGPSAGLNLATAAAIAADRPEDAHVVTVIADSGLKYLHGRLFADAQPTVSAQKV